MIGFKKLALLLLLALVAVNGQEAHPVAANLRGNANQSKNRELQIIFFNDFFLFLREAICDSFFGIFFEFCSESEPMGMEYMEYSGHTG